MPQRPLPDKLVSAVLLALIRAYQWLISPLLGSNCRFTPTCSEYAREALDKHGALTGSYLVLKRIGRCHPWGGSGFDPVPDNKHDAPPDTN